MKTQFISTIVAALLPVAAFAQSTPTAYAERSEIIGTGQEVHLYGLSTKDSTGKIKCFDVTMTLNILASGKPADAAAVDGDVCPKVKVNEFVPGGYRKTSGIGQDCTLYAAPFSGRTEYDLICKYASGTGNDATYIWYSGPIAGNPLEAELDAANLNTLPGNENYSWGKITQDSNGNCGNFNDLFGARQVGDQLTLNVYGRDNVFDCINQFQKTTP